MKQAFFKVALLSFGLLAALGGQAQTQDFSKVEIKTIAVQGNLYMLMGQGGNIGVSVGDDGLFLVDDQFAPLSAKIMAALAKLSDKKVRFLVNSHWHFDHVGGNEQLAATGTAIVAHKNARKRLSKGQTIDFFKKEVPATAAGGLPIISFSQGLSFHLNGEAIEVFHIGSAHTDGDAVVHFRGNNVIHTGDIYFAGMYPFFDTSSGGSVAGMIAGAKQIYARIDEDTKVIPGHGPLSNKKELGEYINMLVTLRDKMNELIKAGKTQQAIVEANPTWELDEQWGNGLLDGGKFTQLLYSDLSRGK